MSNIRQFIDEYERGTVQVTPSISYHLQDTINDAYRLYYGKFEEPTDSTGLKKIFFNIGWALYRTVFFASDIDTKDLQMRAKNPSSIPVTYLLRLAVNHHLAVTKFSRFIDDVRSYMIAFGSAMVKVAGGRLHLVDLRNIVRAPHIQDVQLGGLVEKLTWTYDEVLKFDLTRSQRKEVNALWDKMVASGQFVFTGYEFWTWDDFSVKKKSGSEVLEVKEYTKGCIKYLDRTLIEPKTSSNEPVEWSPYMEIDRFATPYKRKRTSKDEIAKLGLYEPIFPYKQVDFIRPMGRSLGIGVFELIAGLMEYYNEKWHLYRKKDILDLRGIFKHKKGSTGTSLEQKWLDNLETGFSVELDQDEDLERLVIDTKTGEFIASIDKIYEIARQIVGVTAQGVGQDMPSTTTATVAIANKQTQQTTYDYVIEQMATFLVELFEDFYFDVILDELSENEMMQIVGNSGELEELDVYFIDNLVYAEAQKYKAEFGLYPTEDELDAERERLKAEHARMGDMRFAEIKRELIENSEFTIEFFVNSERFDKAIQVQNILQVLQDPNYSGSRDKLYESLLDLLGLQGRNYRKTEKEKQEDMMKAMAEGGGQQMSIPPAISEAQQFGNAVTTGRK